MNNAGAGLAPLGVEGVFGRDPSLDFVGVPGTGASDVCVDALVVRIRDSLERAALYFLEVLKTEGVESSLPATTERGRLGVNGVGRAILDVEGVSVIMVMVLCSLSVMRWVLLVLVLGSGFASARSVVVVAVCVVRDGLVVVAAVESVRVADVSGEVGLVNPGKLAKTRGGVGDAS